MTTDRALLQQALEALDSCDIDYSQDCRQEFNADLVKIAKIAIKARLAQPEQEPSSSLRPYNTLPISPKFDAFIRAFWRRIHDYKIMYGKELPEQMPVEFRASMETALLVFDRAPMGYTHPQPERKPLTVIDIADDDALRFVHRVLESDAPEADRLAAREMITAIRTRVRKVDVTHPQPERKPLTDGEIALIWKDHHGKINMPWNFARAIERAHGITDSTT